jgi:hypothetical protein
VPGGTQLWRRAYGLGSGGGAVAVAVSPDSSTVFVTGRISPRHGELTGVTIAYQTATGAQDWAVTTRGTSPTGATSAAVSPDGSTVYSIGTNLAGMITIAYGAASGTTVWTQEYQGPQFGGAATVVAASPDGATVYVAGDVTVSTGDEEYATVAYQAATGTMRWAQVQNGSSGSFGDDSAVTALAVSPGGGTVFVTGLAQDPLTQPSFYTTLAYSP